MEDPARKTLLYRRSHFAAHLPVDYLYSPSHYWMGKGEGSQWKVGFTKFATRMLGEIVQVEFSAGNGSPVRSGEIIGSVEGFKAISDLYCVSEGTFRGGNPAVEADAELIAKDPFNRGWLYLVDGKPDEKCFDVEAYRDLLDSTIDRILEKQISEP